MASYTFAIVPQDSSKAAELKAFLRIRNSPTGQAFARDLGTRRCHRRLSHPTRR